MRKLSPDHQFQRIKSVIGAEDIAAGRAVSDRVAKLLRRHFRFFPKRLMVLLMNLMIRKKARRSGIDPRARPYSE